MTEQGRFLAELRRSNAAGLHDHTPSKSELRRWAIQDEDRNMAEMTNGEYSYTFTVTVKAKLTEGEASAEDFLREEIRQVLDEANPSELYPGEENEYEITDWSVA